MKTMYLLAVFCVFSVSCLAIRAQEPAQTPAPIREEVTVTAARVETKAGETPLSVSVVPRSRIESAAAPSLDDVLRQTAGFSIFRRSSSRNANPTTQGVSLRGVGASGASRTGVFLDGVPLNDPFGGWVQWGRVPAASVEVVEVLRGGASSLYGDASLSGAINVTPRKADSRFNAAADIFGGSQRTIAGSGFAGAKTGKWLFALDVGNFQTRGFRPVDEAARGPVDVFAGVRSNTFAARIERSLHKDSFVFIRPSYFGEVRTNGTGLQTNRTHIRQITTGGDLRAEARNLQLRFRLFGGDQVYDQVFSVISPARTSEALNRIQRVPTDSIGISIQGSAVFGTHTILAGIESRRVRGASDEVGFTNNIAAIAVGSGGRQSTTGFFVQDLVKIGNRAVLAGSLRHERWKNTDATSFSRSISTTGVVLTRFPDRRDDALSPQLSALFRLTGQVSLFGSVSRSFRSPTLNELYRAFRVGNVFTNANENLKAERSDNAEAGVGFNSERFSVRTNFFFAWINDAISNVTLSTTPTLITRQRQNAGRTRSSGLEIEGNASFSRIAFAVSYQFASSILTSFNSNPLIVGRRIPQVPRHQINFQVDLSAKKWNFALQTRASGEQFDDDLNQFRLEPFLHADFFLSRRIKSRVQVYFAVENVVNTRYSVGKTPIRTVSSPMGFRIGFRLAN
jgi:outer membrane receptor protein involved in Fe transport